MRSNALYALMRRLYRSFPIQDMDIADQGAGQMSCNFKFQFPGTAEEAVYRQAHVKVVKSFDEAAGVISEEIPLQDASNKVANTLKAGPPGEFSTFRAFGSLFCRVPEPS